MLLFPHCKINLGLNVVSKRDDGFHNIETVMIPVEGLTDGLEIVPIINGKQETQITQSGVALDCDPKDNIVFKAWKAMQETYDISPVRIHLHKAIPFGAGLGGGSADAAFTLKGLNDFFNLNLSIKELEPLAAKLGSDVPFFLYDIPMYCTGRGEIMTPVNLSLKGYWLALIKPDIFISTAQAYSGITPKRPEAPLTERLTAPINAWKETIDNAFEETIFRHHPSLSNIKQDLYEQGALYASMTGSGSGMYGIFDSKPVYETSMPLWIMEL